MGYKTHQYKSRGNAEQRAPYRDPRPRCGALGQDGLPWIAPRAVPSPGPKKAPGLDRHL